MQDIIVAIDGNSLINRAFYAIPPLNNAKGEPTNAVFGFCNILVKLITEVKPKYLTVAFDLKAPTFRHKMYDGYKATRKPMPDDLRPQLPKLKEMLRAMKINCLECEGYEADDILGTVSKKFDLKTVIVTGDKDALQLIDDTVSVWLTKKGITEILEVDARVLMELMSLTPQQIVEYKALCGDSSDNIPGVPGVGDKTATGLLTEYGTVDGVYENLDKITGKLKEKLENNRESAYLSRRLARIDCAVPININITDMTYPFPFSGTVFEAFRANSFTSLIKRSELFSEESIDTAPQKSAVPAREEIILSLAAIPAPSGGQMAFYVSQDSVIFSYGGGLQYRIPLAVDLLSGGWELEDAAQALKPYLEDDSIQKICFDAKAMLHLFSRRNITLRNYFDVRLAGYVIDLTIPHDSLGGLLVNNGFCDDFPAVRLFELCEMQRKELAANGQERLYYDVELKLVEVLFDMEKQGFRLDLEVLESLSDKYGNELKELTERVYLLAEEEFNLNSPKQLAEVLFNKLHIPYPNPKAKSFSTGAEILEQVAEEHPVIPEILRYRKIFKLKSTYVEGLRKLAGADGTVHTEFKQMLTTTGRLSSAEPNLQNIPVREDEGRNLRKMFVAKEGNVLVFADYSQIELRLLAHFSGDPKMIAAYKNNLDIHSATAASVFGVPQEAVTKEQRRAAKAVNFGIIYGISDFGLAGNLGISRFKAKEYITRYFENYPSIKEYMTQCVANAREKGYAETALGRRRKLPELMSRDYNIRGFGERAAMNMPLQGSAADLIKLSMAGVFAALKGMDAKLILQVHDELVVECAENLAEEVRNIVKREMENAMRLDIPLTVEVTCGKNWFDAE